MVCHNGKKRLTMSKKIWLLLAILLISDTMVTPIANAQTGQTSGHSITYAKYHNSKYDFSIDFPKGLLFPQIENFIVKDLYGRPSLIDNSDGCIFKNKFGDDILQIKTIENDIDLDASLVDKLVKKAMKQNDNLVVTYSKVGTNFFVISGYRNGNIFYMKAILDSRVIATAILEYPEDEQESYNQVSVRIFKTFKFE